MFFCLDARRESRLEYDKPALTFDQQADRLLERGLIAERDALLQRLMATNYFRLSSYAWPFLEDDRYREDTTLEQVWRLYTFDHRLRTLFIDAIESIEVQMRTQLAYHFAHAHGQFAYMEPGNFPNFDEDTDDFKKKWKGKLKQIVNRSLDPKGSETFAVNYFRDYGDRHDLLPIWMIAELMDLGATLSFFRGVSIDIRKEVASTIGQPEELVLSWLTGLNVVRNRCAHHARLWNWYSTGVKRPNKRKFPEWRHHALPINQMGFMLTVCRYWLNKIAPDNTWTKRTFELFDTYPEIPLRKIGLPEDWREHPLWKTTT
ncbi:MAG: Abi family protein [Lentimonas sp.]